MGNLTRDPEIKYTPKGTAIANFGIAVNRVFSSGEGREKKEEVTFIDIEAWGRTAEVIGEHFKKGRPIFIEGRLKLDQWDDKQSGKKMSKLKVVADSFEFIGGKEGSSSRPAQGEHPHHDRPPAKRPPADPDLDAPEEDFPF